VLAAAGVAAVVGAGTAAPAVAAPAALQPPRDPGVFGFGNNDDGELGNGTVTTRTLGHPIGLPASVKQIAASDYMSAALLPDGTVWTWGATGPGRPADPVPVQVPGLTGITQIAVATDSRDMFAVGPGGSVWAWGVNTHGQLGDGTTVDHGPAPVPGLTGITQVSAGSGYALALRSDGTVWAWGDNGGGELGDGTKTDHLTPEQVPGLSGIAQVLASGVSFAVRSDGTVFDWGFGLLGNGAGAGTAVTPQQVPGLTGITQVASDGGHTLALRSDGTVWAWGDNVSGEVGDGTTNTRLSPEPLSLSAVTRVAAGPQESAAIRSDGTLLTWGDNIRGGLDISCCLTVNPTPMPAIGLTWVSQVAFGFMYGLALVSFTVPPGYVAVPSVIGDTQAQASQDLQAGGLALGIVGSAIDRTCDNIGTVLSQNPAAGSYALRGTHVSIAIGKFNPRLCS
jgi:alpha-tubulin suppressor-like RCC1 family protein